MNKYTHFDQRVNIEGLRSTGDGGKQDNSYDRS